MGRAAPAGGEEGKGDGLEPPPVVNLAGLFAGGEEESGDEDEDGDGDGDDAGKEGGFQQTFEDATICIAGESIVVRQLSYSPTNANKVWPSALALGAYVCQESVLVSLAGHDVLEIGSATGALAVALTRRGVGRSLSTCDIEDDEITENIAHNFRLNGLDPPRHIPHTWGSAWPSDAPAFHTVIASDILIYVSAYPQLVRTLEHLLRPGGGVTRFIMAWDRRAPDASSFFETMAERGFPILRAGSSGCIYEWTRVS